MTTVVEIQCPWCSLVFTPITVHTTILAGSLLVKCTECGKVVTVHFKNQMRDSDDQVAS